MENNSEQVLQEQKPFSLQELGHRIVDPFVEAVPDALKSRAVAGIAIGASALAFLTGVTAESPPTAEAAADAQQAAGQVLHRRSSLIPQKVLTEIHDIALPDELTSRPPLWQTRVWWVRPASAFIKPSSIGFRTNCGKNDLGAYKYYKKTLAGISYVTCGPAWPPDQVQAKFGEYQEPLNQLGERIQKSVKLSYDESTASISGNRKKVTAKYNCPDPSSSEVVTAVPDGTTVQAVKKIILQRKYKTTYKNHHKVRRTYSKATITAC